MSYKCYDKNLVVTLQDFESSGWKEVISQVGCVGYIEMWRILSDSADAAIEQGRDKHGKVLWLLADACSMMLSPSRRNEPFKPFAVFHDRRSILPDDLLDTDIKFFAEIVDAVDDNLLKARISELLWLKSSPRNTLFAQKAIDAYSCLSLDMNTWLNGGSECWQRAISLALMLGKTVGDRLEKIELHVLTAFNATNQEDGYLGLWLGDFLKSNNMARTHSLCVAKKLEDIAHKFDSGRELENAKQYFYAASEWYEIVRNLSKATEMKVAVSEVWVKEAIARTSSESPSFMVASSFYENAIQTLRTVPRAYRTTQKVDERIEELRAKLQEFGELAKSEMQKMQTSSVDLKHIAQNARQLVTGKPAHQALFAFANLHLGANVKELRANALEGMRKYPFQWLFAGTMLSRDGRVIAKRPSVVLGDALNEDDEIAVNAHMVQNYGILIGVLVLGDILPALEVLLLEHRFREFDFIALARNSPIVPKDRAGLFGKALFAGYEGDYVTALHLLIPQIEHLVRVHLKQAGAITTNLDKYGIQNENGMSTLLKLPEASKVFDEDLLFELNSLFCDPFGPNLRNELAHGLLDEVQCKSAFAIYAWWLALRVTVNTWWNSAKPTAKQKGPNDELASNTQPVEAKGDA